MSVSSDIQFSLSALANIISFDLSHPGKETAGLLIGQEINGVVHIDEIRVGEQKGNAVHVVISDDELTRAAIEVSNREDGKVIVGWWHTHPAMKAFLSSTDIKTQSLYQAFMPNSVAVVVDDVKYSKTLEISDLDVGVFRVINGKTERFPYSIKDSVEFGLRAFIQSELSIQLEPAKPPTKSFMPVMDAESLEDLKLKIDNLKDTMSPSDISALKAWVELAESTQDGTIQEVPIDVATLNENLSNSLNQIDETLLNIEDLIFNKNAQKGLFAILIGVIIEVIIFYIAIS